MAKSAEIKTNKWNGLTNYLCPFCPHATTADDGKALIQAHIIGRHADELRTAELEKMTAAVTENPAGLGAATLGPNEEKK